VRPAACLRTAGPSAQPGWVWEASRPSWRTRSRRPSAPRRRHGDGPGVGRRLPVLPQVRLRRLLSARAGGARPRRRGQQGGGAGVAGRRCGDPRGRGPTLRPKGGLGLGSGERLARRPSW
ncbi:unnamed protein product, partial [Tetraodon nigroviridis]